MHTINASNFNIKPTNYEKHFIAAYLASVKFTELDAEDADFDEDFLRESIIDCLAFYSRIQCYLSPEYIEQAGHDFWLTRNGHGTGFWDRPEKYGSHNAELFTKISEHYGSAYAIFEEDQS